jgi:hypothetical protein
MLRVYRFTRLNIPARAQLTTWQSAGALTPSVGDGQGTLAGTSKKVAYPSSPWAMVTMTGPE